MKRRLPILLFLLWGTSAPAQSIFHCSHFFGHSPETVFTAESPKWENAIQIDEEGRFAVIKEESQFYKIDLSRTSERIPLRLTHPNFTKKNTPSPQILSVRHDFLLTVHYDRSSEYQMWQLSTGRLLKEFKTSGVLNDQIFTLKGNFLVSAAIGRLSVIDLSKGAPYAPFIDVSIPGLPTSDAHYIPEENAIVLVPMLNGFNHTLTLPIKIKFNSQFQVDEFVSFDGGAFSGQGLPPKSVSEYSDLSHFISVTLGKGLTEEMTQEDIDAITPEMARAQLSDFIADKEAYEEQMEEFMSRNTQGVRIGGDHVLVFGNESMKKKNSMNGTMTRGFIDVYQLKTQKFIRTLYLESSPHYVSLDDLTLFSDQFFAMSFVIGGREAKYGIEKDFHRSSIAIYPIDAKKLDKPLNKTKVYPEGSDRDDGEAVFSIDFNDDGHLIFKTGTKRIKIWKPFLKLPVN